MEQVPASAPNQSEPMNEALPLAAPAPQKKNLKFFYIGFAGLLAVGLMASLGVGVYRAYALQARDGFTLGVAKMLNLPAAKVNGRSISYADYAEDMRAINQLQAYQQKFNTGASAVPPSDLSDQVLLRLASNILVQEGSDHYQLTLEDKDVDNQLEAMLQRKNPAYALETDLAKKAELREQTKQQTVAELSEIYGWTLEMFTERVLRPLAWVDKVGKARLNDPELRAESKRKAEEVLVQIKQGADFAELAAQYGTDGAAARGGDLGWFGKGVMVAPFETAAWALKKGELSGVVETPFGFHIIKLEERRTTREKDEMTGKLVAKEEISARHILFRPDMQRYLDNALVQAKTRLYIKAHDPFIEAQKARNKQS